jgi:hypothetical protein
VVLGSEHVEQEPRVGLWVRERAVGKGALDEAAVIRRDGVRIDDGAEE